MGKKNFSYEIQYTKAADKFFAIHEDVRSEYEDAVKAASEEAEDAEEAEKAEDGTESEGEGE